MYRTQCINDNNVFCTQFDQNEHFSSFDFEFSSAGVKISAGLNSLGRPQFELDSAHEKFGV